MEKLYGFFKSEESTKGVVSLEACIMLPLFLFVIMFVYGIMIMFYGDHMITHSLIQSGESLALEPFVTARLGSTGEEEELKMSEVVRELYGMVFTENDNYFNSGEPWYLNSDDEMRKVVKNRFIGFIAGGSGGADTTALADDFLDYLNIQNGIDGFDFSETVIEDNYLKIKVKYKQEFLFDFRGALAFDREHSFTIKLWIA